MSETVCERPLVSLLLVTAVSLLARVLIEIDRDSVRTFDPLESLVLVPLHSGRRSALRVVVHKHHTPDRPDPLETGVELEDLFKLSACDGRG